jgi:large subunit ribosomal protein L25
MNNSTLKLEKRNEIGGSRAKRLLESGLVPAVVYGNGYGSKAAKVSKSELNRFLKSNGRNALFKTEFGEEHDLSLIIKNIQYNPVNKEIIHLDFQKVDPQETIQVQVPIKITGSDANTKAGNSVIHQLNTITVECSADSIPQYAVADITSMKPGQSFTAADFNFQPDVKVITKPTKAVVTIKGHKSEPAPEPEE